MSARPGDDEAGTMFLLAEVAAGLARLVRGELSLARAEAAEGLRAARSGLLKLAAAAVVGLVGLNVLAGAAVAGLAAAGLGSAWAALIVGGTLCLGALALALAGKAALRLQGILPNRALRGVRRDAETVRQSL